MAYWLLKSEPSVFSIDDLKQKKVWLWDGVRNYQARNFLREMKTGDQAFFYHSSCPEPGISGLMEIVKTGYPDPTQFDPEDHHYDPKSSRENPRWTAVDVKFIQKFNDILSLTNLKAMPALNEFALIKQGNRLSVMPVTAAQWNAIVKKL
jgi:predicted RNA-binding protein with PUA-like domain